jgi:GNAT superfamily N-acetyltransferase
MVRDLAVYERLLGNVSGSPERLGELLFGGRHTLECLVAEEMGAPIGYALFYTTYSSFRTRPGLWLEDLYVAPDRRGSGAGKRLLAEVARIAIGRGCHRVDWHVLDWNEPAMEFYRGMGAGPVQSEWVQYGMDEHALRRLADSTGS